MKTANDNNDLNILRFIITTYDKLNQIVFASFKNLPIFNQSFLSKTTEIFRKRSNCHKMID